MCCFEKEKEKEKEKPPSPPWLEVTANRKKKKEKAFFHWFIIMYSKAALYACIIVLFLASK